MHGRIDYRSRQVLQALGPSTTALDYAPGFVEAAALEEASSLAIATGDPLEAANRMSKLFMAYLRSLTWLKSNCEDSLSPLPAARTRCNH